VPCFPPGPANASSRRDIDDESTDLNPWPAATLPHLATWIVAAAATAAVIIRPGRLPEAVWAVAGAVVLVASGLLAAPLALHALGEGLDVMLFLVGMMLLAELARSEGLFDTLAGWAVRHAGGSARRLFGLVYAIGILVTVFMSNDATAVVLTPAVHAAAKRAGARPLPYLFACALVANAASFVLPVSNPANLVVFGAGMPPLVHWIRLFALPSIAAIASTWLLLGWIFRAELRDPIADDPRIPPLSRTGRLAAWGVVGVALALLGASAAGLPLGWPTIIASGIAIAAVQAAKREAPWPLLRHVSWSVLPLVGGLFILVAGLGETGVIAALTATLHDAAQASPRAAAWGAGAVVGFGSNLMNNLPAGLVAGTAANAGALPDAVRSAIAVGIDVGPNLSITGSLATILWLVALRREGEHVSALEFLRVGAIVMPVSLALALACL